MSAARVTSASWEGEPPDASVLVPTHDRAPFLPELIDALERQTLERSSFEIVIVDDASGDRTWETLERLAAQTTLRLCAVRAERNGGPATARNAAASIARGRALAFTDDDCLPAPSWLAELLAGLEGADVVQGQTLPVPAEQRASGPWARTVWITGTTSLFETCNLGWRREVFDRLGGFAGGRPSSPKGTRAHFGEDVELGWRMLRGGGTVGYQPSALVHHRVHAAAYGDWLTEQRRLGLFPGLVRRTPGLRRALKLGLFLSWDTAAFDLAVAGVATALVAGIPWPALGTLPWLTRRWRQAADRPGRPRPVRLAQLAVGDVVGLGSLVAGSARSLSPVL